MTDKKHRPWTQEEVPLGAIIKATGTGDRHLILASCHPYQGALPVIYLGGSIYEHADIIMKDYTLDDGSPCGVEDEERDEA